MTIVEFLLARIAEDAKWARERQHEAFRKHRISAARRVHLAPDDPERVMADCEAKRLVVERHVECVGESADGACADLRALAGIYSDHPDYNEQWR